MKKIITGLLGFGMGGRVFHGPLLSGDEGFTLKTVSGRSFPEFSTSYPGVGSRTAEEILGDGEIELVVITAPNSVHGSWTRKALEAGKHVVVDKPFCLSVREAQELCSLAESRRLTLTVFQNRRWDGDFLTIKQLVEDGTLGSLVSFESNYHRFRTSIRDSWKESREEGGGILWDLGAHLVDQALCLFGTPQAWSGDFRYTRPLAESPDDVEIYLDYHPGLRVTLRAAMVRPWSGPRFVLHGLGGSFVKYGMDPQENCLKNGVAIHSKDWGREDPRYYGNLFFLEEGQTKEIPVETIPGSYPDFYRGVFQSLREGKNPPVDPRSTFDTLRILEDLNGLCELLTDKNRQ